MTSDATPAPTGATPVTRGRGLRVLVAAVVVVGFAWFAAAPALAGLGEPVDPRDTTEPADEATTTTTEAEGPTTTKAETPPTTEADGPTTTVAERDGADDATVDEDDGTSIAALGAVGLVAFIVGLLVAGLPLLAALSRKKTAAPARPAPPAPTPTPAPAAGGPAIGPAPSRDTDQIRHQRVVLVEALIALRDQLPSAALGDEAAQALAAAGIHEVRPEGLAFDPAHHRAVHQVSTDDPARHNTVASVERPGYSDGSSTIRLPEVVVAVHGSPT